MTVAGTAGRAGSIMMGGMSDIGRLAAWLFPLLILVVITNVVCSAMGVSLQIEWGRDIPLFGTRLTLAGISELQWHIFSVLVMLTLAYAMEQDRHVRVDVFSARFSNRGRLLVDLIGDLFLLIPFFALLFWFSVKATQSSYMFSEESNSGGLVDRYLIKAILPIGSMIMIIAGAGRILRNISALILPPADQAQGRGE